MKLESQMYKLTQRYQALVFQWHADKKEFMDKEEAKYLDDDEHMFFHNKFKKSVVELYESLDYSDQVYLYAGLFLNQYPMAVMDSIISDEQRTAAMLLC